MEKYKVCVYAICKNEEKFVKQWYESVKEADEVYVLDTGSADNTAKLLKDLGAKVSTEIISPWRFDVARNKSLELVPEDADICVCIDLDEVFEKGWRKKLENIWQKNTTRLRYNYNWYINDQGVADVNFYIDKIHARKNYTWVHPVHEVLKYTGNYESYITSDEITVNHYPDQSKSRGNYLKLLELSVKEDPNDDRNFHYLGREYMYYGKWHKCIDTLIKHLALPTATWKDERCASMRFIARSYANLKRYDEARMWLKKAIKEAPHLRDPLMEMALLEFRLNNWPEVYKYCKKALKIKKHEKSYINEVFSWDYTVYDLLSLSAYYYKKDLDEAIRWVDKALKQDSDNQRLIKNKIFYEKEKSLIVK